MAKVKVLRSYQAVEFGGKLETFFSERPNMVDLSMETLDHGIRVKSPKDHVVIPYANVAYYKLEDEKQEKPKNNKQSS